MLTPDQDVQSFCTLTFTGESGAPNWANAMLDRVSVSFFALNKEFVRTKIAEYEARQKATP